MRRRAVCALLGAVLLGTLSVWIWRGNSVISVSAYTVRSDRLPPALSGLRIAQVSDLHGAVFGARNEALLRALREARPDLIAVTGDLIDSYRTGRDPDLWQGTAETVLRMTEIAPVYYVTGNHESRLEAVYPALEETLRGGGVTVLRNQAAVFSRRGEGIRLWGADDPAFSAAADEAETMDRALRTLEEADSGGTAFTLLLSHRPELLEVYAAHGVDLVLTGHAHGGQFRLPGLGGLVAPGQGLLPAYTSGLYRSGGTVMAVSRGLGNSLFPFRVNNPPELVLITLETA